MDGRRVGSLGRRRARSRDDQHQSDADVQPLPAFEGSQGDGALSRVDEETILYEFTIEDPAYSELWGGQIPFKAFDDLLYEYSCHEGNYALDNILRGARYQERQGNQPEQR